jgi:hypothetical protein
MSTGMFPKEWWTADPQVYNEAKLALRSLYTREVDKGTKEVMLRGEKEGDFREQRDC